MTSAKLLTLAALTLPAIPACHGCGSNKADVVVYTSVDQVFSEPVFQYCEDTTGMSIRAVFDTEETKSTGVLNRLIAEGDHPQADVFWSGDPVRPFVLLDQGLVAPYVSPEAAAIPETFRDPEGRWTGFAARTRVLLVNTDIVSADAMPTSVRDLAAPQWRGQTTIANPLFGTTTMHIAALFTAWGETDAQAFMTSLTENQVQVASSNGEVARLVIAGEAAFGLTDTDDAYESVASGAPVAIVYPDQDGMGALFMPTTVVLINDGPHTAGGQALIDCLLTPEVEAMMAESAHMPLHNGVETPEGVRGAADLNAMSVDYAAVAETMVSIEPWLREWAGL